MERTQQDYKEDLKEDLPLYHGATEVPEPKRSRSKRFVALAAALYLFGFVSYYRADVIDTFAGMKHHLPGYGRHGHHGHHPHGPPPHHKGGPPFDPVEGPFYIPGQPLRTDIVGDRVGLPLMLQIEVLDKNTSAPVGNVTVDVWHADSNGTYSGFRGHHAPRGPKRGDHHRGGPPPRGGPAGRGPPPRGNPPHRGGDKNDHGRPPYHRDEDDEHHKKHDEDRQERPHRSGGRGHGRERDGEDEGETVPGHGPEHGNADVSHDEGKKHHERPSWLRGVQETSEDGTVLFSSIFPGPDCKQASHIHYKLYGSVPEGMKHRGPKHDKHHGPDSDDEHRGPRHDKHDKHHGPRHDRHHGPKFGKDLINGQLFFDDVLVAEVLELAEYGDAKKQIKLADDPIFDGETVISDIAYVKKGELASGIMAKVTLYVDASVFEKEKEEEPDCS